MTQAEGEQEAGHGQGDPRPWEQPGAVRRDASPHRAELLRYLANVSLACSIGGLVLAVPAVPGMLLGAVTRALAEGDLDRMDSGRLDPRGREKTYAAYRRAGNALALGFTAPFLCLALWWGCLSVLGPILVWVAPPGP